MLNGQITAGTQLPAKNADNPAENMPRGNGYGEMIMQPASPDGLDMAVSEGSYFSGVLSGYIPGTGQIAAVQTTYSDTSAILAIANKAQAASGKIIRIDTIKLICSVASASNTNARIVAVVDNISRLGAPGGAALVFNPVGGLSGTAQSLCNGFFGALAIGAVTNAKKIVGQTMLKAAVISANDEFVLKFTNSPPQTAAAGLAGTAAGRYVSHMEPVGILPGQALFLHFFGTSLATAPTFEPLVTTLER